MFILPGFSALTFHYSSTVTKITDYLAISLLYVVLYLNAIFYLLVAVLLIISMYSNSEIQFSISH